MPALPLLALLLAPAGAEPVAPAFDKPRKRIVASAELPFSAETVWAAVAEDYGRIADSHPLILQSDYLAGSLQGELGAERSCWFDETGKRALHEQIVRFDSAAMEMDNRILQAWRFPLDPENTLATYRVEALGPDRSRFTVDFEMRTKPAFLSGMMAKQFEGLMEDYFVALEHHLATGEVVHQGNFAQIAALYR